MELPRIRLSDWFYDPHIFAFLNSIGVSVNETSDNGYILWAEISGDYTDFPSVDFYDGKAFDKLSPISLEDARNGKCHIVFCTAQETWSPNSTYQIDEHADVDVMLERMCEEHNVPKDRVIWISGDLKVNERKKTNMKTLGLSIYSHVFEDQLRSSPDLLQELKPYNERSFSKDFLCFQRWMKPGRLYWSYLLHRSGMMDRGYCSIPDRMFDVSFTDKAKHWYNHYEKNWKHLHSAYTPHTAQLQSLVDLSLSLPLTLDVQDAEGNFCAGEDTTKSSVPYYNTSKMSIITESQIEGDAMFISEAAYRPFLYGHPAIWVGQPGTVKTLQGMGFQTWDWLIDESYDDIPKMCDRLDVAYVSLLKFINRELTSSDLDRITEQNEFNRRVFDTTLMKYQHSTVNEFLNLLK